MSGHWRVYVSAFLLFAGFSTSPASSNPLTDLFDASPKEAAAPAAPAQPACVPQPGRSAAPGQRWVYHLDGRRKCWFQADAATVSARKQIHLRAAKRSATAAEEDEAAPRKKTTLDARAQLLNAAPAAAPQSTVSAPEAVDPPASVPAQGTTTLVPEVPVVARATTEQLTPVPATPPSVDVEMLLAASTFDKDTAASSVPPSTPDAPLVASAYDWEGMAARAGMLLIVLGFVFLVGSLLVSRFLEPGEAPTGRA